jgi:hypothetical protein
MIETDLPAMKTSPVRVSELVPTRFVLFIKITLIRALIYNKYTKI